MGVNKFTANLFLQGDSGWLFPEYIFRLAMLDIGIDYVN